MAFRQIKSPALANQAVIDTKLDASSVSGQTATTSLNSLDSLLIHENATSSLKSVSQYWILRPPRFFVVY